MMNLDNQLARLENAQLVRRLIDEEPTYVFKHALTQDSAYASLLRSQRKRLHRYVAASLEKSYPAQRDELSDVLAYHWEEAEEPELARHYLFRAGQNAARRHANPEALHLFTHALALAQEASAEEAMSIREARAQIYEFLSEYADALTDYQAALSLALQAAHPQDEVRILSRMAWLHWLSGNGEQAIRLAQQVEIKARSIDDQSVVLRAYLVSGLVAQAEGNMAEAYPRMRRALFASRAAKQPTLQGESLFYIGVQSNFMGHFGRAAACARGAYQIKQQTEDRVGELVSLYLLARAEAGRSYYDRALETLERGHAISAETHNPFGLAQFPNTRAWLSAELGDWETAYGLDRIGLQVARAAPIRPPEISTLINLVLDCAALGHFPEADTYLVELERWIGRAEFGFHAWRWQIRLADARARLGLARSSFGEAAKAVAELLDWAACTQSRKYLARGFELRAQVHLFQNDLSEAESDLATARRLADVICYFPTRVKARQSLSEVYERWGKKDEAHRARKEAHDLVAELDLRLTNPDLRRSFERGIKRELQKATYQE